MTFPLPSPARLLRLLLLLAFGLAGAMPVARAAIPGKVVMWGNNQTGFSSPPASVLDDVIAVAGGQAHNLALKADGTVVAWGNNVAGSVTGVPSTPAVLANPVILNGQLLQNVVALDAYDRLNIALRGDGTVKVWGDLSFNPSLATTAATLTNVVAVACGDYHALALKSDGTVFAWGTNFYGVTNVPVGLGNVVAISAITDNSAALRADGTVVVWGDNSFSQCDVPPGLTDVVAISIGSTFVAALKNDGSVVVWGTGGAGPLPVPSAAVGVVAISAAAGHLLALRDDGQIVAWGDNGSGQSTVPTGLLPALAIGTGMLHSLAIVPSPPVIVIPPSSLLRLPTQSATFGVVATGTPPLLYQWRKDGLNLADDNRISGSTTPILTVGNLSPADAGDYAVRVSNLAGQVVSTPPAVLTLLGSPPGGVVTWGDDTFTQLTVPLAARSGVVAVSAGQGHTLALKTNGSVLAWGSNTSGESTVPPAASSGVVAIAAGQSHCLALKTDGTVLAWGNNADGQTNVPAVLGQVVGLAAGGAHSLALRDDGSVVSWGNAGATGPVPAGLDDAVAIAAGFAHSVALRADGTVLAWGDNSRGQSTVPPGLSGVVAIAAGFYHTVAVKADGTVVAWGAGTTTGVSPHLGQSAVPSGFTTARSPAAGRFHSLALLADRTVAAWGDASSGQTTVPSSSQGEVLAISAGWIHNAAIVRTGPTSANFTQPLVALVGQPFNLHVLSSDGTPPLTYQWQNQTAMGYANIPGATGPTLTLANVQTGQAGNYRVMVGNPLGSFTSMPVALQVIAPATFSQWRASSFTAMQLANPAVSGPLADPLGDGRPNLLKYAFNLPPFGPNPMAPAPVGPSGLTLAPMMTEDGFLRLAFHALRPDLVYTVESSQNLRDWSAAPVRVETNGTARTATVRPVDPRATFMRVRVETR